MYKPGRSFIKDLPKTELLKMREDGMSNADIANSLHCSVSTIKNLIGVQPKEMTLANRRAGQIARRMDGTPVTTLSMIEPPKAIAEPAKAVLVVKTLPPMPIPLHGECMDYCISPDKKMIDIETHEGRCLMQIPADKLDTFIAELNAIKANIGEEKLRPFW